jgi:hypothetical protein
VITQLTAPIAFDASASTFWQELRQLLPAQSCWNIGVSRSSVVGGFTWTVTFNCFTTTPPYPAILVPA